MFLISLSLVSCEKAIKGAGHIVDEVVEVKSFDELELNELSMRASSKLNLQI